MEGVFLGVGADINALGQARLDIGEVRLPLHQVFPLESVQAATPGDAGANDALAQRAAIGALAHQRLDHLRAFRQALIDGRQFTGLDALGQHRRFLELGGGGFRCRRLGGRGRRSGGGRLSGLGRLRWGRRSRLGRGAGRKAHRAAGQGGHFQKSTS